MLLSVVMSLGGFCAESEEFDIVILFLDICERILTALCVVISTLNFLQSILLHWTEQNAESSFKHFMERVLLVRTLSSQYSRFQQMLEL